DRNECVAPGWPTMAVDSVMAGSAAQRAGIQPGDGILSVNGAAVPFWDQMNDMIKSNVREDVSLALLRGDDTVLVQATVPEEGRLGFLMNTDLPYVITSYGFFESLPIGASKARGTLIDNAKGLGKIATGELRADKAISGPVRIATMFGSEVNWVKFWTLVG